jgi:hypothetical protein
MISEMNEEEMLEFLMTSEFDGDYSPSELKSLLVKWRYFYRLLYGNMERNRDKKNFDIKGLNDEIYALRKQLDQSQFENVIKENVINELKNRKLTWRERLSGKIKNENESK